MAKPRTSQSRAPSSASGRRSAGSRNEAAKARPQEAKPSARSGKSRPGSDGPDGPPSARSGKGRPGSDGPSSGRSGKGRPGSDGPPSGRSGKGRPGSDGSDGPSRFATPKPGGRPATGRPAASKRTPTKAKQQPFAPNERELREGVRLQKFMASAGVSSRRHAEELISGGAVMVNGKTVKELGTRTPRQPRRRRHARI